MTEGLEPSEVDGVKQRLFQWIGEHYGARDAYRLMDVAREQLDAIKSEKWASM